MKSLDLRPKNKFTKKPTPQKQIVTASPVSQSASTPATKGLKRGIKITLGAVIIILLAAGALAFYILPEATIQVQPRTEAVTRDLEIEVNKNQSEVDLQQLKIPGELVEKEITSGNKFQATGSRNVGKQASGFVYIYNFSKNNLILKKDTTVLSVNGRKYFFTQDAGNIRPTAFIGLEDQEIDLTSLAPPVPVVAEGPGTAYNTGTGSRLEIRNEVFGEQPELLYAVVAEDITGGSDEIVKVVIEGDITEALASVKGILVENAREELTRENRNLKILDDAVSVKVLQQSTSAQVGAQVNEFEAGIKALVSAMIYDESDALAVITDRIERILPKNKKLKTESGHEVQSRFISLSLDQGQGILGNHFEGQVIYQIDPEEFIDKVKGKSIDEIREILLSRPEIEKAEIRFYPFWIKKAPKFGNKVNFEIVASSP